MAVEFKMEGLKELDKQLAKLSRSAGKAALRKSLKNAAKPIVDRAQATAPEKTGDFKATIMASTKLNKAQKKLHKKQDCPATVELFVGSSSPLAHLLEFGTVKMSPQPFMRAAFEAAMHEVVYILSKELAKNISAAIKRAERRAAKKAGK